MEPVLQLETISVEEMEVKYPFLRLWEEWAVSRENPGGHGFNTSKNETEYKTVPLTNHCLNNKVTKLIPVNAPC